MHDPNKERATQAAFDGHISRPQYNEAISLLREVRDACLFDDDDGQIGVTEEPTISADLFGRICECLHAS